MREVRDEPLIYFYQAGQVGPCWLIPTGAQMMVQLYPETDTRLSLPVPSEFNLLHGLVWLVKNCELNKYCVFMKQNSLHNGKLLFWQINKNRMREMKTLNL